MPEVVPQKPRPPVAAPATKAPASLAPPPPQPASHRVISLDALRGFDMFWIMGGDTLAKAALALYPQPAPQWVSKAAQQLKHTDWVGFTAYDLIMPLFLFVVGAAMPFSFSKRVELGHSRTRMLFKILRRTVILFVVGMAVQGNLLDFNLSTLHLFANTLQAIAVGYLIAGILLLTTPIWAQAAAAIFFMLLYWLLIKFVPFGGGPAGVLEPNSNLALTFDKWVLGRFIDGTHPPYTWVFSSMTFASTTLLGVLAGHLLRSRSAPLMKFIWLTMLGAVCLGAGWAWAEYLHFPIIKHIWTSSMVLWAAGWSYLLLALFFLLFDLAGLRFLAFPFVVIGMNAIVVYVAYHLFNPFRPIAKTLVGGLASHLSRDAGNFTIALTTVMLVWLLAYHLYRHKIFLRI